MDDLKDFAKKYWPYIVGGIVGLYLIFRYAGGSSGSSGGSDYAAFLNAQAQAAQQNAQLQAQQAQIDANRAQQQAELSLNQKALDAKIALDTGTLELQKSAVQAEAFNNFTTAQAAMAQSVGSSTAAVINALNAPALTAMQANAYENAAALEAAANVAAGSFYSQGTMVAANSTLPGGLAQAIGSLQIPQGQQQQGKFTQAVELGARAYSAYATYGMSEVARQSSKESGGNYYSAYMG